MIYTEQEYKSTINRIGATLLIFYALLSILQGTAVDIQNMLIAANVPDLVYIFSDLVVSATYLVSFMLPVFFFYKISKGKNAIPMRLSLTIPTSKKNGYSILPVILAGIALIFAAAYLNAILVGFFDYSDFSAEYLWGEALEKDYEIVLLFISMAILPAICEEFLFRGLILTNLLPYGKKTAVVISAILFGFMHGNIEQLLYTTVAGLVLGMIYLKTGSIWVASLLHFFNNFISVFQTAVQERLSNEKAVAMIAILELFIFVTGAISGLYLLLKYRSSKKVESKLYASGAFGEDADPAASWMCYPNCGIPAGRKIKLFFSPLMILFLAVTTFSMILLIVLSFIL